MGYIPAPRDRKKAIAFYKRQALERLIFGGILLGLLFGVVMMGCYIWYVRRLL